MDELFYYNNVKYKIIKYLRGDKSQLELSYELGYNFNQVHKWEVGSKAFTLFDFMDYCEIFNISIEEKFKTIFSMDLSNVPEEKIFNKLHTYLGPKSKTELTALLGVNKSTLYRWLKGNGTPDLALIFYWIDQTTQYFPDTISQIIGKKAGLELISNKGLNIKRRDKYTNYPYLASVEFFFRLKKYREHPGHDEKFIAKELGLTEQEVKTSIEELLRCNSIYLENGKYSINFTRTDIGSINVEASAKMGKYWTNKTLERFTTENGVPKNTGDASSMWAYRIIPVPKKLDSVIKEKMALCIQDIIKTVETSSYEADEVKALVIHMFNVQDPN
jgi:transcriptional regulator with XRE-family HTH domain